jgi:glycosyltransferase involved in cell wall biosynthesis
MPFHIVLPRPMDLDEAMRTADAGQGPRHSLALIARALDARVHAPDGRAGRRDTLRARLVGTPAMWGLARSLRSGLGKRDVVFCPSEAGGFEVSSLIGSKWRRPRIAMFVHNVARPRGRVALKLWARRVDLFMACSRTQVDFLRSFLPEERVAFIWDHTDDRFFTPGPQRAHPKKLVVSVGLEQRDYHTLARATEHLDVDVRISGFSKDAAVLARTFPAVMPKNMTRNFYSWPDLAQLYRDADVVVVAVRENKYAAGVQSLMEAQVSGRPVIASSTTGLRAYLDDTVVQVPPGDASAMRSAIEAVLRDPTAQAKAERAQPRARERYAMDRYANDIVAKLRSLA